MPAIYVVGKRAQSIGRRLQMVEEAGKAPLLLLTISSVMSKRPSRLSRCSESTKTGWPSAHLFIYIVALFYTVDPVGLLQKYRAYKVHTS